MERWLESYTEAWTKYIREQEESKTQQDHEETKAQALKGLTLSVKVFKLASRTVFQVSFFIGNLKTEIF